MNYLDLFSGIGGFSLGFQRAGWVFNKHYNSEVDKYAGQIYRKHFPESIGLGDIRTIRGAELGEINLITFGFPCQDLSLAGKRMGLGGARSGLFFEATRLIGETRPNYIVFENVIGLLSADGKQAFLRCLGEMDKLGYDGQWMCFNSGYWTQQNRERVYFVGLRRADNGTSDISRLGFLWELDKRASNTLPTISCKPIGRGECIIIEAKGKRRWLTPVECERLQGFPDGWTEGISATQRYKCLGNAVTTYIPEIIAKRLKELTNGTE